MFPGTGQMRPFLREVGARRDGPLVVVAPPGAPSRYQKAGTGQRRGHRVIRHPQRHQGNRGIVDAAQEPTELVVVWLQQAGGDGGRGGDHDTVGFEDLISMSHGPGGAPPLQGVDRERQMDGDPPGGEGGAEPGHQRRHATVQRPEQRGCIGTRGGNLGPQGPHETAPSLGRRQQRREGGCRRHVVDRAGVNAPDEGIHQPVDHPPPQLVGHQRSHRPVADGPTQVGPGQESVPGQPGHAAQSEDARTRRGPEPGWDAQRQPFGERANPPTRPDPGPPAADGHERFAESDRVAEIERFGSATEKSIRAEIDHGAPERLTVQGPAQSGR